MLKRILVVLLAVLMLTSLFAACGQKADNQPAENKPAEAKTDDGKTDAAKEEPKSSNLEESLKVDISGLKSGDGQPLLLEMKTKEIPPRPADPDKLPEEDALHWYDMEYAGWSAEKINIPKSPADGAIGKKVIVIINGDHPYLTAYGIGGKKIADAYKMDFKLMSPNWDLNVQNQMIDQAINAKPDMIILIPLDAKAAVQQFRKINQAGIPCIASNMLPEDEGMKYVISWVGPDDWGQFRMLAQKFAEKLNFEGGVCYVRHAPGGSPFYSRTYGPITELKKIAPKMEVLDMQAPGFEAEKTMQVTSDWITKYGDKLKGIVAADDSAQTIGIIEALKKANRTDIVVVAAGNSKIGMDAVKAGDVYAITYQSAEADGAVAVKLAADWFNGKEVPPVGYIPQHVITKEDVDQFMPAQW